MGKPQPVPDEMYLSCCEGKYPFPSPQKARDIAEKSARPLEHYKCPVCRHWHIGPPKRRRK